MMGLLSHVRYATGRDNRFMHSLWRPLKGYTEPNNLFSPDDAKLLWWAKYLATVGGTAAIRAAKETVEERVLTLKQIKWSFVQPNGLNFKIIVF